MNYNLAKNLKEVLIAARWMIENVGWCQQHYEQYPEETTWSEELAPCAFCSMGAIYFTQVVDEQFQYDALEVLSKNITIKNIARWNDSPKQTKRQVLKAFDRAIVACK